jgi:hypothetical protein
MVAAKELSDHVNLNWPYPVANGKKNGVGAEINFADGVPIPPNIRPVIILSGSDYEIGYQWFQQRVWQMEPLMPVSGLCQPGL